MSSTSHQQQPETVKLFPNVSIVLPATTNSSVAAEDDNEDDGDAEPDTLEEPTLDSNETNILINHKNQEEPELDTQPVLSPQQQTMVHFKKALLTAAAAGLNEDDDGDNKSGEAVKSPEPPPPPPPPPVLAHSPANSEPELKIVLDEEQSEPGEPKSETAEHNNNNGAIEGEEEEGEEEEESSMDHEDSMPVDETSDQRETDGDSNSESILSRGSTPNYQPPPPISGANFCTFPQMPPTVTHVGRKPLNGPPCSLRTLVDDGILEPLDGSLTYEIMGAKFFADLLPTGFIRMSGTNQVFGNPSSWANFCRSTIPSTSKDQKNYGSAWSIIRYLGKRLDSYKLRWYRRQKKQLMGNGSTSSSPPPQSTINTPVSAKNGRTSTGGTFLAPSPHHQDALLATLAPKYSTPTPAINNHNNNGSNHNQHNGNGSFASPYGGSSHHCIPSGANNSTSNNAQHFSTPIQFSRANSDYKNIYNMINRDRLYKLDKISAGDAEINAEKFPDENIISFNSINLNEKDLHLDDRTKVCCVPFSSVFCLQPFLVTISTNVLLLIDFHSHLISSEVSGYLAGSWDPRTQHLTITQAYPMRTGSDGGKSDKSETETYTHKIKQNLLQKGLVLVGWYHSHPDSAPHPSLADIKRQLKYQKQMLVGRKGARDYSPCIGLICSPFYRGSSNEKIATLFQMFWVMPVFFSMGNRSIGRPMQIAYNVARDAFLTQDLLVEMRVLASYFVNHPNFLRFNEPFLQANGSADQTEITYWEKLQESLKSKLPRDLVEQQSQAVQNDIQQQALMHFWSFLKNLLLIQPATATTTVLPQPDKTELTPETAPSSETETAADAAATTTTTSITTNTMVEANDIPSSR